LVALLQFYCGRKRVSAVVRRAAAPRALQRRKSQFDSPGITRA